MLGLEEDVSPGEVQSAIRGVEGEQGTAPWAVCIAPGEERRYGKQRIEDGPNRSEDPAGWLPARLRERGVPLRPHVACEPPRTTIATTAAAIVTAAGRACGPRVEVCLSPP